MKVLHFFTVSYNVRHANKRSNTSTILYPAFSSCDSIDTKFLTIARSNELCNISYLPSSGRFLSLIGFHEKKPNVSE